MIKYFIVLILALIFILCATLGRNYCSANNLYGNGAKIENNKLKIQQCEEIKKQLHITAETIRKQDFYDKDFVQSLSDKWHVQDTLQSMLISENHRLQIEIEARQNEIARYKYIGEFKITHYCICYKCCGKSPSNPSYGITATKTKATPGRTIAVDPKKIPYGTKVVIDGHTYVAEDCGGAIKGNRIDICVSSHSEALQKGVRRNVPVYIIKE